MLNGARHTEMLRFLDAGNQREKIGASGARPAAAVFTMGIAFYGCQRARYELKTLIAKVGSFLNATIFIYEVTGGLPFMT